MIDEDALDVAFPEVVAVDGAAEVGESSSGAVEQVADGVGIEAAGEGGFRDPEAGAGGAGEGVGGRVVAADQG